MRAGYYMATLVLHDQSADISERIRSYNQRLTLERLPDIPFHAVDLLHGHNEYAELSVETRKRLLIAFSMFVRTLPIRYHIFSYTQSDTSDRNQLEMRLRKDIVNFVFDRLEMFQGFDQVAIYYDGGHEAVSSALHGAFDFALARNAVVYKKLSHHEKRLAQAADYLCALSLAAYKYSTSKESATYRRFFGNARNLKQNFLKQARKKQA